MDLYLLVFKQPSKIPVPLLHMDFCREWITDLSGEFAELLEGQMAR